MSVWAPPWELRAPLTRHWDNIKWTAAGPSSTTQTTSTSLTIRIYKRYVYGGNIGWLPFHRTHRERFPTEVTVMNKPKLCRSLLSDVASARNIMVTASVLSSNTSLLAQLISKWKCFRTHEAILHGIVDTVCKRSSVSIIDKMREYYVEYVFAHKCDGLYVDIGYLDTSNLLPTHAFYSLSICLTSKHAIVTSLIIY